MLLGVDVGGTFTDAVLVADGVVHTAKAPTTPDDQSRGVMAAVGRALEAAGAQATAVDGFAHGMTVATNALLEGAIRLLTVVLLHQERQPLHHLAPPGPEPLRHHRKLPPQPRPRHRPSRQARRLPPHRQDLRQAPPRTHQTPGTTHSPPDSARSAVLLRKPASPHHHQKKSQPLVRGPGQSQNPSDHEDHRQPRRHSLRGQRLRPDPELTHLLFQLERNPDTKLSS